MSILDKYVSREFLKPIFGSLVLIVGILIVTRVMDDMKWTMNRGQPLELSLFYWLHHLPEYITGILPMCLVFATSYTIGMLNKNNELTAIMVGGNSFFRIAAPMMIISLFLSGVIFFLNEKLVNYSNKERELYKCYIQKYPDKAWCNAEFSRSNDRNQIRIRSPKDNDRVYFIFADKFLHAEQELVGVDILYLVKNKMQERIIASKARYQEGKWHFFNGYRYAIGYDGQLVEQQRFEKEFFPVHLPLKRVTIKERKFNAHFVKGNALGFAETIEYIQELRAAGKPYRLEQVELQAKISMPFMAFILTFLGAATGTRLKKAVIVLAFAQSLFMAFLYILFLQTGKILGREGLVNPVLAAWFGNILFFSVGVYLFRKSRF